jgi:hypothetical protein
MRVLSRAQIWTIVVTCAAVMPAALATRVAAEESLTLASRAGVTEAILVDPSEHPTASVLLLPGGTGVLKDLSDNFLLRVRGRFSAAGFNVAVLDAPSDHSSGMETYYRASAEHAQDIAAAIQFLKQKSSVPVWLIGTSRGTISAANAAVRLGAKDIAGIVLTSSVWSGGMSLVPIAEIAVPVLVVHNRDDGCRESPYLGVAAAMDALKAAPAKELIMVSGGNSNGRPCGGLSTHGYFGIEDQVVPPIVAWIKAKPLSR